MVEEDIQLMDDEHLLMRLKPYFLSFYDFYLIFAWIIILSGVFFVFDRHLVSLFGDPLGFFVGFAYEASSSNGNVLIEGLGAVNHAMGAINTLISPINNFLIMYSATGLWLSIILLSSMAISVFRIDFKWITVLCGICIISIVLGVALDLPPKYVYAIGIILSILGAGIVEIYRLSHTFYLTDKRIITQVRFLGQKQNELSYARINNLLMEQGIVGRIFGFATIIPVTASGIGMGSDFSAVTIGSGSSNDDGSSVAAAITGGRTIQTPRTRSMHALFGIKDPIKVQKTVSRQLHDFVEAPYLKRMEKSLSERMR